MTQDDQFHQYGYDHYLKAPQNKGAATGGIRPGKKSWKNKFMAKFENPVFATIALLTAGIVFAGIIFISYPSGPDSEKDIPIVSADLRPVKARPGERGGMKVPYRDSTVLADVGQDKDSWGHDSGIENLLAPSEEALASKEEELARATEGMPPPEIVLLSDEEARDAQSRDPAILLQKIDKPAPDRAAAMNKESEKSSQGLASAETEDRPKMHAAATSPETIDFVKSVLDKDTGEAEEVTKTAAASAPKVVEAPKVVAPKAASEPSAAAASRIEPAAGAAAPAIDIVKGTYYVQLASIKVRERADSEWKKFQKTYSAQLASADYRIQAANLGERGSFYRIQAGPFSKEQANKICNAIKAQKPGGCLVVK